MNDSISLSYNWKTKKLSVTNNGNTDIENIRGAYSLLLDGEPIFDGNFTIAKIAHGSSVDVVLEFPKNTPAIRNAVNPGVSPTTWGERHLNVTLRSPTLNIRKQIPADFKVGLYPPVPRIQPMKRNGAPLVLNRKEGTYFVTFELSATLTELEWFGIVQEGNNNAECISNVQCAMCNVQFSPGSIPAAGDGTPALPSAPDRGSKAVSEVGIGKIAFPAQAKLSEVRWLKFSGGTDLLKIKAKRGTFTVVLDGQKVSITGIAPDLLVFDDWNSKAEFILTAPFQQNVGTNAFSICCETSREDPDLKLVVDGKTEVPFEFRKADFSGTYFAVARVTGCVPGSMVKYDLSIGGFPGEVKIWKDGNNDFKCAIWGDYQAAIANGPKTFDWEEDPFRAGEMMFRDMIDEKCEFAVTTGDMSDVGDYEKELRPLYLERTCGIIGRVMPFYIAFGNHDSLHPESHFFVENPTKSSFAFVKNNCLFLCIDDIEAGNDKMPASPALLEFVEKTLSSEAARKAKFVFAFQHVAIYEESFGNCNRNLLALYEKYGVDCVFSGDHHGYEHIVRGKIRQIINGCMGYFAHNDGYVNWYGDETLVGGHKDLDATWRFQKPGEPGILGEPTKVHLGLLPGYATLEVHGDTATWKLIGFNADGSKIGVVDTVEMKSGKRPDAPRGLAVEYYCWSKPDDPAWGLIFTLTGKGGRVVRLSDWGAMEVADNVRDFRTHYETVKATEVRWDAYPFHTDNTVGVLFKLKNEKGEETIRRYTMQPDNELTIDNI